MMPDRTPRRAGLALVHPMDCTCINCTDPRPSDPRRALLDARLPQRLATPFALGMATGALIVAATGHMGAALRALFGL